jgi:hypothetical protein
MRLEPARVVFVLGLVLFVGRLGVGGQRGIGQQRQLGGMPVAIASSKVCLFIGYGSETPEQL